jgi:hypothetical protein
MIDLIVGIGVCFLLYLLGHLLYPNNFTPHETRGILGEEE